VLLTRSVVAAVAVVVGLALPAAAHTAGTCAPTGVERCETWWSVVASSATTGPERSDQFTSEVLSNGNAVFLVAKDVALNSDDPYASTAGALVEARSSSTGAVLWRVQRRERAYLSPHAAALSHDGTRIYVTGGAYDNFPVSAKDSRVFTTAYDTATGRELWSASWDARPDAVDNGNYLVVAPDDREVYVAGVTTGGAGDLDYVTLGYDTGTGQQLWSQVYGGPRAGGSDAPFGIAVNPDGSLLYVTGWSDGTVEYDADYGTVAYALTHASSAAPGRSGQHRQDGRGQLPASATTAWVARYDGVGLNKSDRANAIAVDPDGSRVYVTGDSYAGKGGGDYDYATVAYDGRSGQQLWQSRFSGGRGAFNAATTVVATAGRVLVSGQASAPSSDDGNDATTVAYDAATGRQSWTASVAPVRHDDYARGLTTSPDGGTAYLVTSDIPLVRYTSLSRLSAVAYDVRTGAVRWRSELDAGVGNALRGAAVAAAGGSVVVAGDITRSADPLKGPAQDVYDVLLAAFPAA
jgi:outer membrane protein assembly factor BamB